MLFCLVFLSQCTVLYYFFFFFFFHLTYSRWTSSLPSCLWSQRIFPSLPGSRLTIFYRDASSALLQLVNQWLNFTYSRSHAFRYERKNTNPTLVRIELTTSVLADVQLTYLTTRATYSIKLTWRQCKVVFRADTRNTNCVNCVLYLVHETTVSLYT